MKHPTVTRWYVKCQMSVGDPALTQGWASDEENLKTLVEHLKKTWRYVTPHSYQARVVEPKVESKRKKK
ncbi:hypothetical protein [Salmonella phage SSBI34]|nr:hypothetical protein [Salmonella phage SSBI34]